MSEVTEKPKRKRQPMPARTLEARQNQLISAAVDLAYEKLLDGTASSQIITTLLNWASVKAQLELERLRSDLRVADAKVKQIESQESSRELYENAIAAFKSYSGHVDDEEDYD